MKELDIQDKYLINFLCDRADGLRYRQAQANTVSKGFFVVEDLKEYLSNSTLNKKNYIKLLRQFKDEKEMMIELEAFLTERIHSSANMALFLNNNRNFTFKKLEFNLFATSGSELEGDKLFEENIFTVVQELPFNFQHNGETVISFRPDLSFFVNGIYLGYCELKSNYNNQNANKNGRTKVRKDYLNAAQEYLKLAHSNDVSQTLRKQMLFVFEKAIHITTTDISETYIVRNISYFFDDIKLAFNSRESDYVDYEDKILKNFKPYPLLDKRADVEKRFEEVFTALYDKKMIEKEILYYNFIERELIKKEGSTTKEYKHNDGYLISPRPKQKFGTDKIIAKIGELLEHEKEPDYFLNKMRQELVDKGVGENQINELVEKRQKYQNNKNVYSLLLQYAAGFGKSNIIGWTALQLKDLRANDKYVYDKVMLVVDRLQLRDQLDSKMHNMNINKSMFIEAYDQKSFRQALNSEKRIVVVNVQKFSSISEMLDDKQIKRLSNMRIAFLIDEIHRSNNGVQHEDMLSVFDVLQSSFDKNKTYTKTYTKKNLIVGFTATPSDNTLARFGEYNKYAEAEKIWIPFDSYTMSEAIKDGYILNPIKGIVPVSAKMYFKKPENELEGFEGDTGYEEIPDNTDTGLGADGKLYAIRKKKIYANPERIEAISKFIVHRLLTGIYHNIRGGAKAMLAVSSISSAIRYTNLIKKIYAEEVVQKKYERFKDAPVYIVYSESQEHQSSSSINNGISEKKILQNFKHCKNGLIVVVDKLQTGFDEPKLHTLFLDKEIKGINAIQTISRVNRTIKYKNDCKIVDFSYKNINVKNIKTAFEHFSNVVVSDFDPLGDEKKLIEQYAILRKEMLFKELYISYKNYLLEKPDSIDIPMKMTNRISNFIRNNEEDAKALKKVVNTYFRILNLIEFIIDLEDKYSEETFLQFWRRYSIIYSQIIKPGGEEGPDDVEVYFDNKIGIVSPTESEEKKKPHKSTTSGNNDNNKYKYNILRVIEKRNEEEAEIEAKIKAFEKQIEQFFEFIKEYKGAKDLISKIKYKGSAFSREEILTDFEKIFRRYKIRHRKDLDDFFIKESEASIEQLYSDFEDEICGVDYVKPDDKMPLAAEP